MIEDPFCDLMNTQSFREEQFQQSEVPQEAIPGYQGNTKPNRISDLNQFLNETEPDDVENIRLTLNSDDLKINIDL